MTSKNIKVITYLWYAFVQIEDQQSPNSLNVNEAHQNVPGAEGQVDNKTSPVFSWSL